MFKYLIFFVLIHKLTADYYTSMVSLKNLLNLEKDFINTAEEYISDVQEVQKEMQSFLSEVELEHEKSKKDPDNYYGEPTNAYHLIKRMVVDWKYYKNLTTMTPQYIAYNNTIDLLKTNYEAFTKDDLMGAAIGLKRLQDVYSLDTENLAQGVILNKKYSANMSVHDVYIMASSLFSKAEYASASEWFMQALVQLDKETEAQQKGGELISSYPLITRIQLLESFALSLFNAGNLKLAKLVNDELLKLDRSHEKGLTNKKLFDDSLLKERHLRHVHSKAKKSRLDTIYHQVCKGELTKTAKELRPLRCRFVTNNIGFYLLGPLKMEELNHDPFVAVYYETIYDKEIQQILESVQEKLKRSIVEIKISDIRTSQEASLSKKPFLMKVRQRLEDITGLSLASAEDLKVVNYGIGGHYDWHYDFFPPHADVFGDMGNRLLTALYYMSDVELGGSTAFPFLRLAVPPIKGSLLVWYNMHDSTEVDYRTLHAGCPVLKGSKWSCTEWFHEALQEFKRPCGLRAVGDKYDHYIDTLLDS